MKPEVWRRPTGRAVVRGCLQWTPWLVLAAVVGLRADGPAPEASLEQAQADALARQAYQVLKANCFECHADARRGGLDLRTAQGLAAGGATGKVVVAHDPEKSRLFVSRAPAAPRFGGPKAGPPYGRFLSVCT